MSDETELAIQRKQRDQTEGLAMFDAVLANAPEQVRDMMLGNPDAPTEFSGEVNVYTTHPDSVAGQSQAGQILRHFQVGGTLTALDALDLFGCNRLAARVADLKNKGYNVKSRFVTLPNGKRVSEYWLQA